MLNANAINCFCLCLILLLGMVSSNVLAKGQTTLVSVATGGTQGDGNSYSTTSTSLSADGRYVAFISIASNLVVGDTNGTEDVFVHDRLTKQTTRVSVATGGTQANGSSYGVASLSAMDATWHLNPMPATWSLGIPIMEKISSSMTA